MFFHSIVLVTFLLIHFEQMGSNMKNFLLIILSNLDLDSHLHFSHSNLTKIFEFLKTIIFHSPNSLNLFKSIVFSSTHMFICFKSFSNLSVLTILFFSSNIFSKTTLLMPRYIEKFLISSLFKNPFFKVSLFFIKFNPSSVNSFFFI